MTNPSLIHRACASSRSLALVAPAFANRQPRQSRGADRTGAGDLQGQFDTSKGVFVIEVHRDWAPNGADRFYNLVKNGFYDDVRFFRVISRLHGAVRHQRRSEDLGAVARGAHQRRSGQAEQRARLRSPSPPPARTPAPLRCSSISPTTPLDSQGFSPFGQVVSGMDVVDTLYAGYGEGAPRGRGPDQGRVQRKAMPI